MTYQIISEAQKIVAEVLPTLEAKFNFTLPKIVFRTSARMTRSWGHASLKNGQFIMTLSSHVYTGKTDSESFRNTVCHELAHLAEYKLYMRSSNHGYNWRELFASIEGARVSKFVTKADVEEIGHVRAPKRLMTSYIHHCGCKAHKVGGQIHNKLLRGYAYTCRTCGGKLGTAYTVTKA